ncbi:hypothetical protein D9M72_475050 [compost metagenome]
MDFLPIRNLIQRSRIVKRKEVHKVVDVPSLLGLRPVDRIIQLVADILFVLESYRQWFRFICFSLHLVDIPICHEKAGVYDTDICTYFFNFLSIP